MIFLKNNWKELILIVFIVLIQFAFVSKNNFSLDDEIYYSQVEQVKTFSDIPNVLKEKFSVVDYRPVTTFTFATEKAILGSIHPNLSHVINLFIYTFNCLLLYIFLSQLKLSNTFVPLIATVLFTSLPLHASMVANIKSRDGLLSFMFGMIFFNLIVFILKNNFKLFKNLIIFFIAALAILLGIFSKLDTFNFIIASPLLFFLFKVRFDIKNIIRFILIGAITIRIAVGLFDFWTQSKNDAIEYTNAVEKTDPVLYTENPIIKYQTIDYKIAYSVQTVFEYVKMVFKPNGHYYYFGYDMIPVLKLSNPIIWIKFLVILFLILSALLLYKKNKLYSFGVVFFFVSLIYCSNLVTPVAGIVADRYAYIASMGASISLGVIMAWIVDWILRRFRPNLYESFIKNQYINTKNKLYVQLAFILPVLILSLFYLPYNIQRCKDWKTLFSIFEADLPHISLKSYEANRIATKSYVETAINTDDPKLREVYFRKGLKYGLNGMNVYGDGQYIQDGIIMSIYGLNDFLSAVDFSRKVIAKFDTTEIGWRMLTEYYYSENMLDSAALGYRKLINILPTDPNLYFFYVNTLQKNKQTEKALNFTDSLIQLNPDNYIPYQAKAYLYMEVNDSLNASLNIEKAMERGLRNMELLDYTGKYWWTRDRQKWEYLKKYVPK